jgi:hypothetical protein
VGHGPAAVRLRLGDRGHRRPSAARVVLAHLPRHRRPRPARLPSVSGGGGGREGLRVSGCKGMPASGPDVVSVVVRLGQGPIGRSGVFAGSETCPDGACSGRPQAVSGEARQRRQRLGCAAQSSAGSVLGSAGSGLPAVGYFVPPSCRR